MPTTLDVTRQDCISRILEELPTLTDMQLESVFGDIFHQGNRYNFHIVEDYSSNWPYKYTDGHFRLSESEQRERREYGMTPEEHREYQREEREGKDFYFE